MARSYTLITATQDGPVARIALHNPARKNAIGPVMVNELLYALDDARDEPSVRVVVITGSGETFSVGGDVSQMATVSADGAPPLAFLGDFADLLLRFPKLGKPAIARVRGAALGGGLGIVASCDFAIAAESAVLGTPEIKRGIFPMQIMAPLARVVPRRKLLELMLLGEKVSATEGRALGLVSHVVPDAELDAAVDALAAKLAALSPTAMRMGLGAYHEQADRDLASALPYLREQLIAILGTEDAREGLTAFLEKREPKWTGR